MSKIGRTKREKTAVADWFVVVLWSLLGLRATGDGGNRSGKQLGVRRCLVTPRTSGSTRTRSAGRESISLSKLFEIYEGGGGCLFPRRGLRDLGKGQKWRCQVGVSERVCVATRASIGWKGKHRGKGRGGRGGAP